MTLTLFWLIALGLLIGLLAIMVRPNNRPSAQRPAPVEPNPVAPPGRGKPYRISRMPTELHQVVDRQIKAGISYREIAQFTSAYGYPVSSSGLCLYARRTLHIARRKPLQTQIPME